MTSPRRGSALPANEAPTFVERYREAIVAELRAALAGRETEPYGLMRYHLGWQDRAGRPIENRGGKLLRPALCLLCCEALGGDWQQALPAAAALELVHNFTLIHDDVEDMSDERHDRETVWRIWGSAQAINAGDGMFALANATLLRLLERGHPPGHVLRAAQMLDEATLRLCEGQHLDLAAAEAATTTLAGYMAMIEGKTAALVAACCAIGAVLAGQSSAVPDQLHEYGRHVGLAFQIRDDFLGIWGDESKTGKPVNDDLRAGKRSYPVVVALDRAGPAQHNELQALLAQAGKDHDALERAAGLLEELGARDACEQGAREHAERAIAGLEGLSLQPGHRHELEELARFAAGRQS